MAVRRFRYALRPTRAQVATLRTAFAATDWAFAAARQRHLDAFSADRPAPTRGALQAEIVPAARAHDGWEKASSVALQQAVAEADRLCRLAREQGTTWPRPRTDRTDGTGSIHLTLNSVRGGFKMDEKHVRVPKVGDVLATIHRPLPGPPSSLTVGRDASGWFASYVVEVEDTKPAKTGAIIGIDVGVKHLASWVRLGDDGVDSRGRVENPRVRAKIRDEYAKWEAKRDGCEPGSRRWKRADQRLAKIRARSTRQRLDHARKAAAEILDGARLVCVEGLDIRNLHRNGDASGGAMADAALGMFLAVLAERAEKVGATVVVVPSRYTSMTCPACMTRRARPVPLDQRDWTCEECGLLLDRDFAAAAAIIRIAHERVAPGALGETETARLTVLATVTGRAAQLAA